MPYLTKICANFDITEIIVFIEILTLFLNWKLISELAKIEHKVKFVNLTKSII